MKKIAAERNYYRVKNAGFGDMLDAAQMVREVLSYAQGLSMMPAVPMTTIYNHGSSLLALFNRVKASEGVPEAVKAVANRMVDLGLIAAEDTIRG